MMLECLWSKFEDEEAAEREDRDQILKNFEYI